MPDKDFLQTREHALEDQYFRQRDQELIAELRRQGRLERERRALDEELAVVDEAFLSHLQEIGFSPDNLILLHLVPLVEVAWAEGEVTASEKDMILALAERRGVAPDSAPHEQLVGWLEHEPTKDFFETATSAVRALLDRDDKTARQAALDDLVDGATRIAETAGGILGMGSVCREERECLKRINQRLTEGQQTVAGHRLSSMLKRG